jgi:hypothetical protein
MKLRLALIGLMFAVAATPALAQSMNAELFHKRATALRKKGPLALFSRGEINKLTAEGNAAGRFARDARRADIAAGRKPRFCPPGDKVQMSSDEFMTRLSAIPRSERARIDMGEATIRILAAKVPCPA